MVTDSYIQIYELLLKFFGPQGWWPGDSRFEIIIGAILTQNTNWTNVEKAISNIKKANCLEAEKLHALDHDRLAALIRPAGYYNIKAKRLKNFLDWLFACHGGDVDSLEEINVLSLREELLSINGIGPETADSIALYGYDKPVFVIDAYTCRILGRHGLLEPDACYEDVRELMESSLPVDVRLYNEYHALLVRLGKDFCRPKPRCSDCPLECMPHDIDPVV